MMKNVSDFAIKTLFILKIFKFLYGLFGHVEKELDQQVKINFKIYDLATWLTTQEISQEIKTIRWWNLVS